MKYQKWNVRKAISIRIASRKKKKQTKHKTLLNKPDQGDERVMS